MIDAHVALVPALSLGEVCQVVIGDAGLLWQRVGVDQFEGDWIKAAQRNLVVREPRTGVRAAAGHGAQGIKDGVDAAEIAGAHGGRGDRSHDRIQAAAAEALVIEEEEGSIPAVV